MMEPIETARLILRPFLPTDWRAVFAIFNDTAVARYSYYHDTEDESRRWVTKLATAAPKMAAPSLTLALVRRHDDQLIGWISSGMAWRRSLEPSPVQVDGEFELSYALGSTYWGQGYMVEAVTAVINYLFSNTVIPQITADCETDNHASRRVMEKSGMVYEGIEQHYERDLSLTTYHRFSLSRQQWQQVQNGKTAA